MKLPNTSGNRGFTVIEIVVTIGILLTLLALTAPFTLHAYRRYQIVSERNLLLALLRQARTLSLSGVGSEDHGVHVASVSHTYTLFEGPSYAARDSAKDQVFEMSGGLTFAGPQDILFRYLSGRAASASFTLDNGTKRERIYVNTEGSINW